MSSWYTPERCGDWPGSSPPERNTDIRDTLLWQHVFLGGLGMKTPVRVAVVQAGLRGCKHNVHDGRSVWYSQEGGGPIADPDAVGILSDADHSGFGCEAFACSLA
ncbi:unnamed protein product [Ectocarpus sp. 12 AP-2014]